MDPMTANEEYASPEFALQTRQEGDQDIENDDSLPDAEG
jgi:hypothetical protein